MSLSNRKGGSRRVSASTRVSHASTAGRKTRRRLNRQLLTRAIHTHLFTLHPASLHPVYLHSPLSTLRLSPFTPRVVETEEVIPEPRPASPISLPGHSQTCSILYFFVSQRRSFHRTSLLRTLILCVLHTAKGKRADGITSIRNQPCRFLFPSALFSSSRATHFSTVESGEWRVDSG